MVKPKRERECPNQTVTSSDDSDGGRGQENVGSDEDTPRRNELPEFFKIYLPALCSNSMGIPPEFLEKFGGNIPTNVILRMSSGLSWQVHVQQIREHWFFQKGWPEFVQENSVEDGDFLIFSYAVDSVFSVKVFARNGCRKKIDRASMEPVENTQGEEALKSENDDDDDDRATVRNVHPKVFTARKTGRRNPSFQLVMKSYFIHKCCTYIPMGFWKAHMNGATMATLWIKDKSWEVALVITSGRLRFSAGWPKFARDNHIMHGDICTFQLMNSSDLSLKVTIS